MLGRTLALGCLLLLVVPGVAAQTDTTRALDPVVVTGTRIEVARRNAPLTVSTVSRADIERSGESNLLPVLSARVPGLFVTERGVAGFGVAEGAAGQISVRGVGGSPNTQVLVLVDGQPQFMGLMGHTLPDTYVAADAERVEVVRGPASVLYGTGAMGGVLNIITRRDETPGLSADARVGYGSYRTQQYGGGVGYRAGRAAVYASAGHDRTDGHRDGAAFDQTSGYVKGGFDVSPGLHLMADGGLSRFNALDPGPVAAPYSNGDHWADITRGRAALALANRSARAEGSTRLYYSFGGHTLYDGFKSDDFLAGLMAYQGFRPLPGTLVTVGVDHKTYGGRARNTVAGRVLGDHTLGETGGYALVQQQVGWRLLLNAGLRVEHHTRYGAEAAPQVGLVVHATAATTLRASVARGFRSPSVRELYLFPPSNPDLRPERLWNYEVSLARRFGAGSVEATGFVVRGDNLIQSEGVFPNVRFQNSGAFTNRGLEVQGTYRVSRALTGMASYSYLHAGRRLTAAPEHMGFVEGVYRAGRISLSAQVQRVAGLYTSLQQGGRTAYTLVNATLAFRPLARLDVFVRGENLLDRVYEINYGYPMPGATVHTGLHLRY